MRNWALEASLSENYRMSIEMANVKVGGIIIICQYLSSLDNRKKPMT